MLLTLASLATQAQDVYEYATVNAQPINSVVYLYISYSSGEYKEVQVPRNTKQGYDMSSTLKQIALMSKEGWEVISGVHDGASVWRFFLKRKVKQ